uniref:KRAB domain-containing protein n=1 Tax=Anolis carolinensis TaxID=28377 RepID=A0A803THT9_ANOCA
MPAVDEPRRTRGPAAEPGEVTFEDVAVSFSSEEWSALQGWQKALHKEVMLENYSLLLTLGKTPFLDVAKPPTINSPGLLLTYAAPKDSCICQVGKFRYALCGRLI